MKQFTLFSTVFLGGTGNALAHVGHVGELAGHAHWIGVGALAAAAALAALLAKSKQREKAAKEENEVSSGEGELEGETA